MRCFSEARSCSRDLRLMSSRRSTRPRRNFGWENSQVWASVEVRWARGVCWGVLGMTCRTGRDGMDVSHPVDLVESVHVQLTDEA